MPNTAQQQSQKMPQPMKNQNQQHNSHQQSQQEVPVPPPPSQNSPAPKSPKTSPSKVVNSRKSMNVSSNNITAANISITKISSSPTNSVKSNKSSKSIRSIKSANNSKSNLSNSPRPSTQRLSNNQSQTQLPSQAIINNNNSNNNNLYQSPKTSRKTFSSKNNNNNNASTNLIQAIQQSPRRQSSAISNSGGSSSRRGSSLSHSLVLNRAVDIGREDAAKRRGSDIHHNNHALNQSHHSAVSLSSLTPATLSLPVMDSVEDNSNNDKASSQGVASRDAIHNDAKQHSVPNQRTNSSDSPSNTSNNNIVNNHNSVGETHTNNPANEGIQPDIIQNSPYRQQLLPTPLAPAKCPLLCVFYAEFDIVVGPKVCFSSPQKFMSLDVNVTNTSVATNNNNNSEGGGSGGGLDEGEVQEVHAALEETFSAVLPNRMRGSKARNNMNDRDDNGRAAGFPPDATPNSDLNDDEKNHYWDLSQSNTPTATHNQHQTDNSHTTPIPRSPSFASSKGHNSNSINTPHEGDNSTIDTDVLQNSIFSATSEYIITGNELANQTITVSTHGTHILSRPMIICNERRYERNSLLFSVGFVLRRNVDPRPYWPLLSNLSSTLRYMEVESEFLSNPTSRPRIQIVLEDILISLNSKQRECHLLLDDANLLNLQLFKPPPPPTPTVPDYAVPILLRPEWQLQMYDWDLTINWIVPNIDGIKNVVQIAQSSEVDMEMVRACLRVLRHHGVLAHVDIFRYSNIYECTPLAMELLSVAETKGTDQQQQKTAKTGKKLLDSAFWYSSKSKYLRQMQASRTRINSSNSDSSMNYQMQSSTPSKNLSRHGNLSSIHGLDLSLHSSTPLASLVNESIRVRSLEHDMYAQPRSFPSRTGNLAIAEEYSTNSDPPANGIGGTMDGLDANSSIRKEISMMKLALAHIYSSCNRNQTFGEILLAKMTEEELTLNNASSPEENEDVEGDYDNDKNALSPLREGTDSNLSSPSESQVHEKRTTSENAEKAQGVINWKKAFHYFDHRRLVTFGVLHGLIKRVRQFPLACDVGPGSGTFDNEVSPDGGIDHTISYGDEDGMDDLSNADFLSGILDIAESPSNTVMSTHQPISTSQLPEEPETASLPTVMDGATPGVLSPSLSLSPSIWARGGGNLPPPPLVDQERMLNALSQLKQQAQAKKALLEKIADSMDGTRCDDELSCLFEMPMEDLVDLVKGSGRWEIIYVFSSTE